MKIKSFEFNPISENTYVLYDETKECVIIDAGCFYPDEKMHLFNFINDNDLVIKHLLNTHLHFDHVFGLNFMAERFGLKTKAHKDDEFLLEQMPAQLRRFGFESNGDPIPQIGTYLNENDMITFGNQQLVVLHVPGHSPGHIVFYNEKEGCLFVGDVLFRDGVGRTDLPGGNTMQLVTGIRKKLFTLPADTVVYSGHGPTTTIGYEKKYNTNLIF